MAKKGSNLTEEHKSNIRRTMHKRYSEGWVPHCIAVRCIETGEEFSSMINAMRAYNIHGKMREAIILGHAVGGYHFEFVDPQEIFKGTSELARMIRNANLKLENI